MRTGDFHQPVERNGVARGRGKESLLHAFIHPYACYQYLLVMITQVSERRMKDRGSERSGPKGQTQKVDTIPNDCSIIYLLTLHRILAHIVTSLG